VVSHHNDECKPMLSDLIEAISPSDRGWSAALAGYGALDVSSELALRANPQFASPVCKMQMATVNRFTGYRQ
jgi:hypothetical protein